MRRVWPLCDWNNFYWMATMQTLDDPRIAAKRHFGEVTRAFRGCERERVARNHGECTRSREARSCHVDTSAREWTQIPMIRFAFPDRMSSFVAASASISRSDSTRINPVR